jgi:ABC-type transport system involved in cytochrome bd biosynthesis fused ATPase/permease subunit
VLLVVALVLQVSQSGHPTPYCELSAHMEQPAMPEEVEETNLALARIVQELERLKDEADTAGLSRLAHTIETVILEARERLSAGLSQRGPNR